LTPYTGGNLGDAAIQDSMIANLRIGLPAAEFSGISLNNQNYLMRHGSDAYSLCALSRSFWGMAEERDTGRNSYAVMRSRQHYRLTAKIRSRLHRVPGLARIARAVKAKWDAMKSLFELFRTEWLHWLGAYRFIQKQRLLVICGGGQLDEEWGGPWGHPYALFKWTLLSNLVGIPCAMASVGACRVQSRLSRFFLAQAIRFSSYRSYRDENSKRIASSLSRRAAMDSVVPDLAFCLPESEIPAPSGFLRSLANGRKIVAISPIIYGKPGSWPSPDGAVFSRYLSEMTAAVSQLLDQDYFLVFVWSGGSDQSLIADILSRVDGELRPRLNTQTYIAQLEQWRDLVSILRSTDVMIASRLHSTLLGFLAQIPVVAISFDAKVDWAMQDMQQQDALLQIRDFTAASVLETLHKVESRSEEIGQELSYQRNKALRASAQQNDRISQMIAALVR
jgi:polysaccharide pyruvyl transferase WcaK-like protein